MKYEIRPSIKTPGMMGVYEITAEKEEEIFTGTYQECLVELAKRTG